MTKQRPDSAIDVRNRQFNSDRGAVFQCWLSLLDEFLVQCSLQAMLLTLGAEAILLPWRGWYVKNRGQVETLGFPVIHSAVDVETVNSAYCFFD